MQIENAVLPTGEQINALAEDRTEGPIVMVNLLKFRERAAYHDGRQESISGLDAYMRYATKMRAIVEAAGGRFLFTGDVHHLIVGSASELWDKVGLVEYPSREVFLRLAMSPEVQAIGVDREAGLEGQLLIQSTAINL
jgi:uncharacterized protein (DUF1330 family)